MHRAWQSAASRSRRRWGGGEAVKGGRRFVAELERDTRTEPGKPASGLSRSVTPHSASNSDSPQSQLLGAWRALLEIRDFPDTGCGGRLLVAELARDSIAITSQCELETAESKTGFGTKSSPAASVSNAATCSTPLAHETGAGHAVVFGRG